MLAGKASAEARWPVAARPDADRGKVAKPAPRPARTSEIVYANVEGGYENLSISTMTAAGSLATGDIHPVSVGTSGGGAFYGVCAGVRLAFLTLGGRARGPSLAIGSFSTIDGELGARVSLNPVEPYFTFGAGYAKLPTPGPPATALP